MTLDFATLDALRIHHPAWRLLRSDHAALVASFLHRLFVAPNVRVMAAVDLAEALEDDLYALRQRLGDEAFPKSALEYLNDWAAPEKGWLKLFQQLNLQLLIVTPLQKIHIIEPFVSSVGFVSNEDGRASKLRNLTIEEYKAQKETHGMTAMALASETEV